MKRHRRDDGERAGSKDPGLARDRPLDRAFDDVQHLLRAVGMLGHLAARLEVDPHGRARGGARRAVDGEGDAEPVADGCDLGGLEVDDLHDESSFHRTVVFDDYESAVTRVSSFVVQWCSVEKRPYKMRVRAQRQAETRQRIVEAAVELHGTLGPAQTSLSAVAERAGVQRNTLYAHFADERALWRACSAHWRSTHPFPAPDRWEEIEDPTERLAHALCDVYGWYASVEPEYTLFARDAH